MKKILTLLVFIFIAFFASGQTDLDGARTNWSDIRFIINENFDTIYFKVDSLGLEIDTINNVWVNFGDSIEYSGKAKTDTFIVNESIGIGVSHPLIALHINKGLGLTSGIGFNSNAVQIYESSTGTLSSTGTNYSYQQTNAVFGVGTSNFALFPSRIASYILPNITMRLDDGDTGLGWNVADEGVLTAGGKAIASYKENVTEQFIINPKGDYTGTLSNPNLAISDDGTGLYKPDADTLNIVMNDIKILRLTEDSIYMDSTAVVNKIKFADGTEQITAGAGSTGSVQVARGEVLHTNTVQTTVITLPATAILKAIMYNVFETFDGSGTDLLDIGITGTPTKYFSSEDVTTIKDEGFDFYEYFSTSTNITFTYNDQNADATQGKAYVYVFYSIF